MSQAQTTQESKDTSVNVMFRGALPPYVVKDYVLCALGDVMDQKSPSYHLSNEIRALRSRHSIAAKVYDNGQPFSVEICSLSGELIDDNPLERLLAKQARHAIDAKDFTVVNFSTESVVGRKAVIRLAEMMNGVTVRNWKSEDQYSLYWPDKSLVKQQAVTKDSAIDTLVMPSDWSRLNALALLCHVASQRASDKDVSLTLSTHILSAETVATLAWEENAISVGGKFMLSGHENIAIYASLHGERDLLAQVALLSGGVSACGLYHEGKSFRQFDVAAIEQAVIPSLDAMRAKVIAASVPTRDLMTLLSKSEGAQAAEMLSEVVRSLSTADCSFVRSQKCRVKETQKTASQDLDR